MTQYPGGFKIQCNEIEEEEDGIHTLLQRHQSPSFVREVEEIEGTPAHIKISMAFEPGIVRLSALAVADEICEWPNKLPAFPLFLCAPKTAIQGVARSSPSLRGLPFMTSDNAMQRNFDQTPSLSPLISTFASRAPPYLQPPHKC